MPNHRFQQFIEAQESTYDRACAELQSGRKSTHWMWFIFPQLSGLGNSEMSKQYAILNLDEARRYLEHKVLGKRLVQICKILLTVKNRTAHEIFGTPDDMKLRSSMTLFSLVPRADPVFKQVLDKYYEGQVDPRTLELVNPEL